MGLAFCLVHYLRKFTSVTTNDKILKGFCRKKTIKNL